MIVHVDGCGGKWPSIECKISHKVLVKIVIKYFEVGRYSGLLNVEDIETRAGDQHNDKCE